MNIKTLIQRIWERETAFARCPNCGKREPDVFISNRDPHPDVLEPIYLCRPCFQRLIVKALEREGYAVVDMRLSFDDLLNADPMDTIQGEQRLKRRDWHN